eukprot:5681250-Prorocentrum_lima.AAC.1
MERVPCWFVYLRRDRPLLEIPVQHVVRQWAHQCGGVPNGGLVLPEGGLNVSGPRKNFAAALR